MKETRRGERLSCEGEGKRVSGSAVRGRTQVGVGGQDGG